MRYRHFLLPSLLFFIVAGAGCAKPSSQTTGNAMLTDKEWQLESFNETPTVSGYIIFDPDGKYRARFCNGLGGSYVLDNQKFISTNTISTLMACPDNRMTIEQTFVRALAKGLSITLDNLQLVLTTEDGSTFRFHASSSIPGTTTPESY